MKSLDFTYCLHIYGIAITLNKVLVDTFLNEEEVREFLNCDLKFSANFSSASNKFQNNNNNFGKIKFFQFNH